MPVAIQNETAWLGGLPEKIGTISPITITNGALTSRAASLKLISTSDNVQSTVVLVFGYALIRL
jgi:hypothetical protein